MHPFRIIAACAFACWSCAGLAAINPPLPNPVLFVTQVPMPGDDVARMTVTSSFANHLPTTAAAPRGGDLMRLAADGTLRNLTAEAGYGSTGAAGFQDANAIAVRDPAVHWSGTKAIFSMVVGAPAQANGAENCTWQLYEVSGIGNGETATITKVANQPAFNNIHPNHLSDGSIVFVSDRPRNGAAHLYPVNDEYRAQPANSGLWRTEPARAHAIRIVLAVRRQVRPHRVRALGSPDAGRQPHGRGAAVQIIAADGSVALFVPARRALTWQTLSPGDTSSPLAANWPVVRERYWIEYQPGEIRACDGCHGVNTANQAGLAAATNKPQALIDLLNWWKLHGDGIFADQFGP